MAGSVARPGFRTSSYGYVHAPRPLPEEHGQQTFGHDCSPAPFADVCVEAAEEQRYLEGQDEGHSERQVGCDVNADGGGASRRVSCAGDNNAGPIGTFCEPAYFMPGPYGCPAPSTPVPNRGWRRPFRARGVDGRGESFRGGGFRPWLGGAGQRPPVPQQCRPPMASWAVRVGQPGTQWRTPFRPRFGAPTQRPFLRGAMGRGGLGGFGNRPSLRPGGWSHRGGLVHNQQADSGALYFQHQSNRGRDDASAVNAQDGPERHHRPSLPRDDFATAGWARGCNDFPFPRKEFVTAGDDSRYYEQRKRTHRDTFRPGDDDDDYCGDRGRKRDRRDRADDEVGRLLRCDLGDRRSSVATAVASNEVIATANASRDCRDNALYASRDRTEMYARTERGAIGESVVGKGKSSNVSKLATVHSRIEATPVSGMKVTDSVCAGGVSARSKLTSASDADLRVFRNSTLPDERLRVESRSASKETDALAERATSFQACSGDGHPSCTSRSTRLDHDRRICHPCGAVENTGIVCRGYRCGVPRRKQNADATLRAAAAKVSETSTESRTNAGTARQLYRATDKAGYKDAETAVENMLKLIRLQAPRITDEHAHLESPVSDAQDAGTCDAVPCACSHSLGTDGPARHLPCVVSTITSDENQAHVITEATLSSSAVHDDVNTEVTVNADPGSTTGLGDTRSLPADVEQDRPVYGVDSTGPAGHDENEEEVFDKGPDSVAGPSGRLDRDAVPADPLAAFVRPAKDVTAAVHQWLDSSFPDVIVTGWSGREWSRQNRDAVAAVSCTFVRPCSSIISLSSDVDCERETESFASTVPDDLNEVIVLSENFPAREMASLARCGVATVLSGSTDVLTTSRPSVEDLQLLLPLSSREPDAETESGFTSAAALTEDVLFRLNACTALYVANLCRDGEAKRRVLGLYARGRRTGATEALAVDMRKIACAAVERKRVLWKDLTCVLRRLARVRWVVPEAGIGAGVKIQEICVPGSHRSL